LIFQRHTGLVMQGMACKRLLPIGLDIMIGIKDRLIWRRSKMERSVLSGIAPQRYVVSQHSCNGHKIFMALISQSKKIWAQFCYSFCTRWV